MTVPGLRSRVCPSLAGRGLPVILLVLATGCSLFSSGSPADRLERNRQRWADQGQANYAYTVGVGCFCPTWLVQPARVVVRADTVAAVRDPSTGEPLQDPSTDEPLTDAQREAFPTIDGLFDMVERAVRENADRLDVRYDSRFGHPREIGVDFRKGVADDELSYTARDLALDD